MNLVPHTVTPAISSVFATVPALVAAAGERAITSPSLANPGTEDHMQKHC
jgi:hypothetical protein